MRRYHENLSDTARELVDQLPVTKDTQRFRCLMTCAGRELAKTVMDQLASKRGLMVVCTNEDADFLAKGFVEECVSSGCEVYFTCFWNQRIRHSGLKSTSIVKSYREPCPHIDSVVVLKSIIATSCVVQTNLSELLHACNPNQVFVASPVLLSGAVQRLKASFPKQQAEKFQFAWFAEDDQRLENGNVVPGIGGSVYELLGVGTEDTKNSYLPEIVKSRRHQEPRSGNRE